MNKKNIMSFIKFAVFLS